MLKATFLRINVLLALLFTTCLAIGEARSGGLEKLDGCLVAEFRDRNHDPKVQVLYIKGAGIFKRNSEGSGTREYVAPGSTNGSELPRFPNATGEWTCIQEDTTTENLVNEIEEIYKKHAEAAGTAIAKANTALAQQVTRTLAIQLTSIENDVAEIRNSLSSVQDNRCPSDDEEAKKACEDDLLYQQTVAQISRIDNLSSQLCVLRKIYPSSEPLPDYCLPEEETQ